MKTIFNVKHYYDVDGGFGDAIGNEELIATFANEADAKKFAEIWDCNRVYDSPYSDLYCGCLSVEPVEIIDNVDDPIKLGMKLLQGWAFTEKRKELMTPELYGKPVHKMCANFYNRDANERIEREFESNEEINLDDFLHSLNIPEIPNGDAYKDFVVCHYYLGFADEPIYFKGIYFYEGKVISYTLYKEDDADEN